MGLYSGIIVHFLRSNSGMEFLLFALSLLGRDVRETLYGLDFALNTPTAKKYWGGG